MPQFVQNVSSCSSLTLREERTMFLVQDRSEYLKAWLGCDGWPVPQLEEPVSWRDTSLLSAWVSKCLVSFLAGGTVVVVQSPSIGVWVLDPLPTPSLAGTHSQVHSWGLD